MIKLNNGDARQGGRTEQTLARSRISLSRPGASLHSGLKFKGVTLIIPSKYKLQTLSNKSFILGEVGQIEGKFV